MEKIREITNLRSIRSFKEKEIPDDILKNILEAGRHTPSVHNAQPWQFIVVSKPEIKSEMAQGRAKFIEDSALIIVGCGNLKESPRWYELEVAIAIQSMVLAAWIKGIGSCWIDIGTNTNDVRAILKIPSHLKIVALVAFGYPAKIPEPTWKKTLDQIVHYNTF